MPSRQCVTDGELRAFLVGDLPDHLAEPIGSHLETCPTCEAAARRLDDQTDPLMRSLQRALGSGTRDDGPAGDAAPPRAPRPARVRRVEGYDIREELGRGGM